MTGRRQMRDQPAHGIAVVCADLVEGQVAEEAVEQDDRGLLALRATP